MSTSEPERLNGGAVLSEIERGYVAQGYCLPDGITWEMVHEARAKWGTPDFMVPVVVVPGVCVGWAVPRVNGKPMRRA